MPGKYHPSTTVFFSKNSLIYNPFYLYREDVYYGITFLAQSPLQRAFCPTDCAIEISQTLSRLFPRPEGRINVPALSLNFDIVYKILGLLHAPAVYSQKRIFYHFT
jgi:hypothetical protein